MHRREFLLSATGIVGATTVGSIAYTSATVKRDVTSVVSEDANAVIGLSPGSTSAVTKSNGKLVVDTTVSDAQGLNIGSTFTYGDSNNPASTDAFSITNNDGSSHDIKLELVNDDDSGPLTTPDQSSFRIDLYDSGGSSVDSVTSDSPYTMNLSSTDTYHAIITIDTSGMSDEDSISGQMKFTE